MIVFSEQQQQKKLKIYFKTDLEKQYIACCRLINFCQFVLKFTSIFNFFLLFFFYYFFYYLFIYLLYILILMTQQCHLKKYFFLNVLLQKFIILFSFIFCFIGVHSVVVLFN